MTGAPASARTPAPSRRRRWPRVLAVLAILLLAGAWWVHRQLEPHRLADTVLARAGAALGLELTYDGDPDYALRPEPRLLLPRFSARVPGAATPLLTAARVEVSLPWSTLLDGEAVVITRLELDAPVLDLPALSAWLESRPPSGAPFELPTLTDGVAITDGRVAGDGWHLQALDLALPQLAPGAPAEADIAGEFVRDTMTIAFDGRVTQATAGLRSASIAKLTGRYRSGGTDLPFQLQLGGQLDAGGDTLRLSGMAFSLETTLPRAPDAAAPDAPAADAPASATAPTPLRLSGRGELAHGADGLAIEALSLQLDGDPSLPALSGDGSVHVGDTIRVELTGLLTRWPAAWPQLPGEPVGDADPLLWSLAYDGGADLAAPVALHVERGETRLFTRMTLPEVLAWLDAENPSPLPPLGGTVETPSLTIGGVTLEGVRIRFEDDATPETVDADTGP